MGTAQNQPDLPVDESFQLFKHLGTGGFAHTWQARVLDEALVEEFETDIVAMKIPLNKKMERVLAREVGLNEHLKGLQDCNVVRYLGFSTFRNQIVMLMEYVADGSLRNRIGEIDRQKPLPFEVAVGIAQGTLRGLSAIHRQHIFHRDIKPENILMEGDTPKIADLGIARMLASKQLASTTTGTIYYMAPEILGDAGATFSADLWSLGVTLYEMVVGRLPFGKLGTPIGTIVDLIRREELVPACEARSEVPAGLSKVLDRTLDKDPARRYSSAEEMCEALSHLAQANDPIGTELSELRALLSTIHEPDTIEAKYREFIAAHSDSPRGYQLFGEFYNQCARFDEAIEVFNRGREHAPQDAMLNFDLGMAYQRVNRRDKAAQCLKRALANGLDAGLRRSAETILKLLERTQS